MNKLSRALIATTFIITGAGLAFFAVSLIYQIADWIMITLCLVFFAIGVMTVFSGIQIARGGDIRQILGELLRRIGR